jgi:hypothetical protein
MEQSDSSVRRQEWDKSLAVLQDCLEFDLMSCSFVNLLEFIMLPFMLLTKVSFLHLLCCGVGNFLSHILFVNGNCHPVFICQGTGCQTGANIVACFSV